MGYIEYQIALLPLRYTSVQDLHLRHLFLIKQWDPWSLILHIRFLLKLLLSFLSPLIVIPSILQPQKPCNFGELQQFLSSVYRDLSKEAYTKSKR